MKAVLHDSGNNVEKKNREFSANNLGFSFAESYSSDYQMLTDVRIQEASIFDDPESGPMNYVTHCILSHTKIAFILVTFLLQHKRILEIEFGFKFLVAQSAPPLWFSGFRVHIRLCNPCSIPSGLPVFKQCLGCFKLRKLCSPLAWAQFLTFVDYNAIPRIIKWVLDAYKALKARKAVYPRVE